MTNEDIIDDNVKSKTKVKSANKYQIRPSLKDAFKGSAIKQIIQSILVNVLEGKQYSSDNISTWISEIADDVSTQVKNLNMKRYKHIVSVVIVEQRGAGCRYIARCRWDAECDSQVTTYFTNETMTCIVTVFGVYLY